MSKTYAQTYLFTQYSAYEKKLIEFIMTAERIDTNSKEFEDVLYDFKRRNISNTLMKIITSKNVVLGIGKMPLPKAFKVFTAKDIKEDKNAFKVFIDVSEYISMKNGQYACSKIEWLICHITSAMVSYIYSLNENKIIGNSSILKDGGFAFSKCFTYVIDRMYKVSTVQQLKTRIDYIGAIYYQVNIMGKDLEKSYDTIKATAMRIADIEPRDAQMVDIMFEPADFTNIDTFLTAVGKCFGLKDIKTASFIDIWMKSFGTGTVFAVEYFPAFSTMMTDAYVGGYLNQQMTIEKIIGPTMVSFTKTILQIGATV